MENILEIKLDMITFAGLGGMLLLLGNWLVKKYKILWRYSIPSPVIGGFGFAIIMWFLYELDLVEIQFDNTLSDLAMYVFFVTIGLTTSLGLIKKGGLILVAYILVCWFLAVVQSGVSIGLSYVLDINPLISMMAGQASMQGGHGMAGSLAPLIESLGGSGALTVGMAASTFGLIAGSLLGGPVGNWLIKRNNLEIKTDDTDPNLDKLSQINEVDEENSITPVKLLVAGTVILVTLAIGLPLSTWITHATGFSIPGHIFSLFLGVLLHSINEKRKFIKISIKSMQCISLIALEMFLVMAMMKLKIWELYDLAIPLAIVLVTQVITTIFIAVFIMYRVLGKNYDAAVMSAGFIGHGLGATPNGLVVMDAICNKYGVFSRKAFIIIPIAGTILTDIVGVPLFVFLANYMA